MSKALKILRISCVCVISIGLLISIMSYSTTREVISTPKVYTLTDIHKYRYPIVQLNAPMYDAKLTFESEDGQQLTVKTCNGDKYVCGKEYSIILGIAVGYPAVNSIKIEEA